MKLPVVLLLGSAALNAALVVTFVARPSLAPAAWRDFLPATTDRAAAPAPAAAAKPAAAGRTLPLWSSLDTADLPALVARLRAAGFPASVIRAIAAARIETQFSERMRRLAGQVESAPYWRPLATSFMHNARLNEERAQIYRDRARQLRELLGLEGLAGTNTDATAAQLRQYGNLSPAKIALLERINDDYAEMSSQVRAEANGVYLAEDREKLALLEREKRTDLAAILTAQELEDYEMRSSTITMRLRSALTLMDATEAEFRTLFRIQQQFADPLEFQPGAMRSPVSFQERQAREKQISSAVAAALGAERAVEYERAQHYEFQQLARLAQQQNLDLKAAITAYELRGTTAEESNRIRLDRNLSPEAKTEALRALGQRTREKLQETLGATAAQNYANSATWLQAIESGRSITFNGRSMMIQSVNSPPPPGPR